MATIIFTGNAQAKSQVTAWVFGGTWEATDIVNVTINGKTVAVVAGSTTISTIVDTVVTALNLSTYSGATMYPEFQEITWSRSSNSLVGTADTAGKPFTCTVSTTETGGGAADAQTIDGATSSAGTDSTANSGPNDVTCTANYSGGALPVDGDTLILRGDVDLLYNLGSLSTVDLAELRVESTFTGDVGLPTSNPGVTGAASGSYAEYRATELSITATALNIYGTGGRFYINVGSVQCTLNVYNTGTPADDGTKTVQWRGTHASNAVNITKGSLAIGQYSTQTAVVATLNIGYQESQASDSDVFCGSGVTLTTITKSGGDLTTNSAFTTLNHYGGEMIVQAGAPGTVNNYGGRIIDRTSGTSTATNVYDGAEYDCRQGVAAKTFTNVTLYAGATFRDPTERGTFTNPISLKGRLDQITLELGTEFSLQRS